MATYASLSDEDKAVIQNLVNIMRSDCGAIARIMNHLQAIKDDSNAIAIFNSIDNGQVIPNTSGLSGADSVTKDELATIYTDLIGHATTAMLLKNTAANRNLWTKMVGISNMIG